MLSLETDFPINTCVAIWFTLDVANTEIGLDPNSSVQNYVVVYFALLVRLGPGAT